MHLIAYELRVKRQPDDKGGKELIASHLFGDAEVKELN